MLHAGPVASHPSARRGIQLHRVFHRVIMQSIVLHCKAMAGQLGSLTDDPPYGGRGTAADRGNHVGT
jgi:hypothetical protein